MYLYDEIGGWGVTAQDFTRAVAALDVDVIDLRINSPGGSVFDGMAIMNALRRHRARIDVTVDGLAASAASFITAAGDHVVMNSGSELMIHEASTWADGDARKLRGLADTLDKISGSIADVYAKRTGGDAAEWRELMLAETWFTAEEAVTAGLADAWVDAPAAKNSFDLSRFAYSGRSAAPAPRISNRTPTATRPGAIEEGGVMALRDDLIERLGLDAEATDDDILEAVDTALEGAEEDGDSGDEGGEGGDGAENSRPAPGVSLPDGVTAISQDVLAQLQSDAAAGREALATQARERREGIVNAAVRNGQITPASRDTWLASLERDEKGAAALLGTLAKGSAVPVVEVGHSDEPENAEDALYTKVFGAGSKEA